MTKNLHSDSVLVRDGSSRRKFIRQGSAFLAVGAVSVASIPYAQADCDSAGEEGSSCADSDAGENADAATCGCEKPKISISKRGQSGRSLKASGAVKTSPVIAQNPVLPGTAMPVKRIKG